MLEWNARAVPRFPPIMTHDSADGVNFAIDPAIWNGTPARAEAQERWGALTSRLDTWRPDWRSDIGSPEQPASMPDPDDLTDQGVFEALAVAAIAANARWDRIAAVRDALGEPLAGFDAVRFATLDDAALAASLAWFRARRAGGRGLFATLERLQTGARILSSGAYHGPANYLRRAMAGAGADPEALAMLLGTDPSWKLPGIGVAVAAEALRLLGFDLCKPDRHVLRALASWRWVRFAHWDDDGMFAAPQPRPRELLAAMLAVRRFAEGSDRGVSYVTSAIWLAGAVSGARLTNRDFVALAISG